MGTRDFFPAYIEGQKTDAPALIIPSNALGLTPARLGALLIDPGSGSFRELVANKFYITAARSSFECALDFDILVACAFFEAGTCHIDCLSVSRVLGGFESISCCFGACIAGKKSIVPCACRKCMGKVLESKDWLVIYYNQKNPGSTSQLEEFFRVDARSTGIFAVLRAKSTVPASEVCVIRSTASPAKSMSPSAADARGS